MLVSGAMVALPLAALAQEPGRTYRLGCLSPHPRGIPFNLRFLDNLTRRAGFIEGQNLTIDYRAFAAHIDLISQYAAELVKAQPDVIYAASEAAIHAIQQATKSIPIIGIAGDMVAEGLVESLARPNGNTTGISIFSTRPNDNLLRSMRSKYRARTRLRPRLPRSVLHIRTL